jgi:hypothetical protein
MVKPRLIIGRSLQHTVRVKVGRAAGPREGDGGAGAVVEVFSEAKSRWKLGRSRL